MIKPLAFQEMRGIMPAMKSSHISVIALVALMTVSGSALADNLFESRDLLEINLAADFRAMFKEKDKLMQYPARFQWGSSEPMDVLLEVRGNFRLENCQVPGLRIIFPRKMKKGLFAKQKKLKLVAQCRRKGDIWEDYLLQEYTIYRAYEALTEHSFQTRLVSATYVDTGDRDKTWTNYGFFIEDKGRMAKRLDLKQVAHNRVSRNDLARAEGNLAVMYHFLVGNTDFSHLKGEGTEACCHNAKLLERDDGKFIPVPYDFDLSGIINTRYAAPPVNLGINKVTQRLYRGFCDNNDIVPATLSHMQSNREAIYAAFMNDRIRDKTRKKMSKYLDRFFAIADNDKKIRRKITGKCR